MLIEPPVIDVQTPPVLVTAGNLDLTGYWLERASEGELDIYPYWYVRQTPPGDTLVRWQLRDQTGQIVSATTARPYFNSQQASDWPPGTLVDDAYRLSLPPGLPAGSYDLGVQILQDGSATDWATVGAVTLDTPAPAVAAQPPAAALPTVRFGGLVEFTGYDLTHDGQAVDAASPRPLVLRPGDTLDYTLYWQPLQPLLKNYHGFIHLIDSNGQPLAKRDKVAGSFLRTPMSWDARIAQPDHYSLQIPRNAPSGLYWPTVGLYEFRTVELLPVADSGGQSLGDIYRLPPVKVLGVNATAPPQTLVSARLGDLATLLGYDLALPEAGLRPGSQFDLTLYYQVNAATDQDLTQFVQLYHPDLGMAAQRDARPLDGGNPTWAWVPGEIVAHTTTLQIRPDAAAGEYHLFVGLYDPGDGTRLAIQDAQGTDVPDRQVDLTPLVINP